MADINHIITMGIGTPGDIEHFTLMGLNGEAAPGGGSGAGRMLMVGIGCLIMILIV